MLWWAVGVLLLGAPSDLRAQSAVGTVPEAEPPASALRIGPMYIKPNLAIRELGVDGNVFDSPSEPQDDYVIVLAPDLTAYMRSGVVQLSVLSSTDLTYYHKFSSERSVARQLRVRSDFHLSRIRPTVVGAIIDARNRPNHEIDLRARRSDREMTAGVGFEVSPLATAYVGATVLDTRFIEGETYDGVALDQALNRRGNAVQAGLRLALTPFTTMTLEGQLGKDRFVTNPLRNSDSRGATAAVTFSSDAVIVGTLRVGYRDFTPADPALADFRGLVTSGALSFNGFWRGRVTGSIERDVQYSFDDADGYYVGTTGELSYTQRVLGPFDAQVRVARGRLAYVGAGGPGRDDAMRTYAAGVGYNRDSGARLGLTFEESRRDSVERADRRYTRRRVYASLSYGF
jgi:hypothetical protein